MEKPLDMTELVLAKLEELSEKLDEALEKLDNLGTRGPDYDIEDGLFLD